MAWDESGAWLAGAANKRLYQDLLDDATTRPERMAFRKNRAAAATAKPIRRSYRLLAPLSRQRWPIGMGCTGAPITEVL